jgi:hypothetical protein
LQQHQQAIEAFQESLRLDSYHASAEFGIAGLDLFLTNVDHEMFSLYRNRKDMNFRRSGDPRWNRGRHHAV